MSVSLITAFGEKVSSSCLTRRGNERERGRERERERRREREVRYAMPEAEIDCLEEGKGNEEKKKNGCAYSKREEES